MLAKWMQAEDIRVANLLQWGHYKYFHNTPQYAFAGPSVHREGDYLVVSGQENPRTHFRGHAIIWGAREPIHRPDDYLVFKGAFEEAHRQKALCGYAHAATGAGGRTGLGMDLPDGLIDFIEVLQDDRGIYDAWYEVLNSGFRVPCVAGTDWPCCRPLPGRERFYTLVKGELTYERWLEGIRAGRTFVTNGPFLEFRVDGREIGDVVSLGKPGAVRLEGAVLFDPARDPVEKLEVIRNGEVVNVFTRPEKTGVIRGAMDLEVPEACWLALRLSGPKAGERPGPRSHGHTAPIYVTIEGAPAMGEHPRAKKLAGIWISRLDDLRKRLGDGEIEQLAAWPVGHDGVQADYLRRSRRQLLEAVASAREYFADRAR